MLIKTKGAISIRASSAQTALLLLMTIALCACGGGNNTNSQLPLTVSGNWQFTLSEQLNSNPTMPSFTGGLQGGFLVQNGNSVFGQATFSVITQPPFGSGGTPTQCDSGVAQITGTFSGQTINLTATSVGQQTYTLTGTLSYDGSTITGTYTSTDGAGCGIAVTQAWSASAIPILNTTSIQGIFHSTGGKAGLKEQDFQVSGALFQGTNTGASSAPLTGSLNFSAGGYPCFAGVTVAGQISGNAVSLQILDSNNTVVGQLGQPTSPSGSMLQPLTMVSTAGGYVLQSLTGPGYAVFSSDCGGGTLQAPADSGSVCLALTSTTACHLPLSISPGALGFPPQPLGSKTTLTVTLLNPSSSAIVDGLTISLINKNNKANFTETDNCGAGGSSSQGRQSFTLQPTQFCTISIGYSPQQSCAAGSPAQCLSATLSIASSALQTIFNVPVTGAVGGASELTSRHDSVGGEVLGAILVRQRTFNEFVARPQLPPTAASNADLQNSENHAETE
jgi:hypothetical protein